MTDKMASFCILYLEIGRGHPFYLDGIAQALAGAESRKPEYIIRDVFSLSHGLSLFCWKIVRRLYCLGGHGGIITYFYNIVRRHRKSGRNRFLESVLGKDIRKYFENNKMPVLISHPILALMLADIVPVYYQHGELACPDEAVTNQADKIFVPTEWTKNCFIVGGAASDKIILSGLCIEKNLIEMSEACFQSRLNRIKTEGPLTAVFYSSGAEPPEHIKKIVLAAKSLTIEGFRSVIFCRTGGRLDRASRNMEKIKRFNSSLPDDKKHLFGESNIIAVIYENREEEDKLTTKLFPLFDILVSPAHERSNWALGLGLPIFILYPEIGTFAPINRQFLHKRGVAFDIDSISTANELGPALNNLRRNGSLVKAAENGFGRYQIDGFSTIREYLMQLSRGTVQ